MKLVRILLAAIAAVFAAFSLLSDFGLFTFIDSEVTLFIAMLSLGIFNILNAYLAFIKSERIQGIFFISVGIFITLVSILTTFFI